MVSPYTKQDVENFLIPSCLCMQPPLASPLHSRGKIYVALSLSLGSPLKASLKCPGLLGCPCLSKATVTCPSHPEDSACGRAEQKWSESTVLHGNTQCPLDPFQFSSYPLPSTLNHNHISRLLWSSHIGLKITFVNKLHVLDILDLNY